MFIILMRKDFLRTLVSLIRKCSAIDKIIRNMDNKTLCLKM